MTHFFKKISYLLKLGYKLYKTKTAHYIKFNGVILDVYEDKGLFLALLEDQFGNRPQVQIRISILDDASKFYLYPGCQFSWEVGSYKGNELSKFDFEPFKEINESVIHSQHNDKKFYSLEPQSQRIN